MVVDDELENKVRSLKHKVEENSTVIERIVTALVTKYNKDLNAYIETVKKLMADRDKLTDLEVEDMVLRIPMYMYFASGGLEALGIESDNAQALRKQAFNDIYLSTDGTIQDKTKGAELSTFPEYFTEVAFARAYKKLKIQLEMAEHLSSAAKKILTKRIAELEARKLELGYHRGEGPPREN